MSAFYNETDPVAVYALRHLIKIGVIADGVVDDRSIKEVQADDIKGFTQVHFFAGAGTWSVSARLAGWRDERPFWTASCPCQPFSAAGKGAGTDDPRHLWPDVLRIVKGARAKGFGPNILMGEQVSDKAGYGWFDGVRADMAREGFASGTLDIPSLAVDAPHKRNRLYWASLDDSKCERHHQSFCEICTGRHSADLSDATLADGQEFGGGRGLRETGPERDGNISSDRDETQFRGGDVADSVGGQCEGRSEFEGRRSEGRNAALGDDATRMEYPASRGWEQGVDAVETARYRGEFAATDGRNGGPMGEPVGAGLEGYDRDGDAIGRSLATGSVAPTNGRNGTFWSDAEWVMCHDGKLRRAKPGLRLLVDGMAGRNDLWRLAGNSINAEEAAEAIRALMDVLPEWRPAA